MVHAKVSIVQCSGSDCIDATDGMGKIHHILDQMCAALLTHW